MSCLRDPESMEPPSQPYSRAAGGATSSNFSTRCVWQEDHYGRKGDVGLRAVDLAFDDAETRQFKPLDDAEDGGQERKAPDRCFWNFVLRIAHIFQSKKFKSAKLERLYQRYFFRLNQSSLTMLMGMLVVVCGVMLVFHCVQGPLNVAYTSVLSVSMVLFLTLMVVCNRNGFHQDYMWIVSYLVMAVLVVVQVFGLLMVDPPSVSEGIWWTIFFIYIIYTLLPVRMRAAVITGAVLSIIHIVMTWRFNLEDYYLFKQVPGLWVINAGLKSSMLLLSALHKRSRTEQTDPYTAPSPALHLVSLEMTGQGSADRAAGLVRWPSVVEVAHSLCARHATEWLKTSKRLLTNSSWLVAGKDE
ncbi:hypothetical protein DNTS_009174, partial [Danionella cerebrum]